MNRIELQIVMNNKVIFYPKSLVEAKIKIQVLREVFKASTFYIALKGY